MPSSLTIRESAAARQTWLSAAGTHHLCWLNHHLQLEWKHPLQIDVLSLQRPPIAADRASKCSAIVGVIACCSTCGKVTDTPRDSGRMNDSRPDSLFQPLCAWIFGRAEVKTDKLDPRRKGKSLFGSHPPKCPLKSLLSFRTPQRDGSRDASTSPQK